MLERAMGLIEGSLVAELEQVAIALRLMAERNRIISEGAGAVPVACAIGGQAGHGKVVCIVSGGNIDFNTLCRILTGADPAIKH
jgi:threonine dehydratase